MDWSRERLEHCQCRNTSVVFWVEQNQRHSRTLLPSEREPGCSYILSLLNLKSCCIPVWIHNLDQFTEANWAVRPSCFAYSWLPLTETGVLCVSKKHIPQPLSRTFIRTKPMRNRFWKSEGCIWKYFGGKNQYASTNTVIILPPSFVIRNLKCTPSMHTMWKQFLSLSC